MAFVDKTKLFSAFKINAQNKKTKSLHWCQYLVPQYNESTREKTAGFRPKLTNLFGGVSIPISLKEIEQIRNSAAISISDVPPLTFNIFMSDSEICLHGKAVDSLVTFGLNQIFGCSFQEQMEVNVSFSRMTLCGAGGCIAVQNDSTTNNPGTFGKFVLQIPVEGGYEGGMLRVGKLGETSRYSWSHQSDRIHCCAIFLSGCKYEWTPVSRGFMVVLEYDLVSSTSILLPLINPSVFLSTTKLIRESLIAWDNPDHQLLRSAENVAQPLVMRNKSIKKNLSSPPCNYVKSVASQEQFLIIPLEEKYQEGEFNFSALHGKDRHMVQILQSIEFIDLHLAVVECSLVWKPCAVKMQNREIKEVCLSSSRFQITQLIDDINSVPQFKSYHLDLVKHMVGALIPPFLNTPGGVQEKCHYPVFFIQPLHQSVRHCITHNFGALLDHLEARISSEGASRMRRLSSLKCLGYILQFCQDDPLKVWGVKAPTAAKRTRSLLNLCKDLNAAKEGLLLIHLLSREFLKKGTSSVFYEGIRDSVVARSIVDLVLHTAGWRIYAAPVLKLINGIRLMGQFQNLVTIAVALVEKGCIGGAVEVTNKIHITLSSNSYVMRRLDQSDVDAYVDSIILLETYRLPAASVLNKFLLPFVDWLSCRQQFHLLVDLLNNHLRLKGLSSCLEFYKQLARKVLENGISCPGSIPEMVTSYPGDPKNLELFIDDIWRQAAWFDGVVKAAIVSPLVRTALEESFKKLIVVFKELALDPSAQIEDLQRTKLVKFFLVLLQLERTPQLADSTRLESFDQVYPKMPAFRLHNLVVDIMEQGGASMTAHPSGRNLLLKLGQSLLQRGRTEFQDQLPILTIVKILKFLVYSPEVEPACRFVQNICRFTTWNPYEKNLLINNITSSTEIWSKLLGNKSAIQIVLNSATELITSCIAGLMEVMDMPVVGVDAAEDKERYLRIGFAFYFVRYLQEKKDLARFRNTQEVFPSTGIFSPLVVVNRMSVSMLGYLLWDIYQSDLRTNPSLKNTPKTLQFYTLLCYQFVSRDLTEIFKPDSKMLIGVTLCLLWCGDVQALSILTEKMLAFYPVDETNIALARLVKSTEILQLANGCPRARNFLRLFLVHRILAIVELECCQESGGLVKQSLLREKIDLEKFFESLDVKREN